MFKAIAICTLAASAAFAGHLAVSAGTGPGEVAETTRSFITPRIDGRRLDVRYSAHALADPAMTAQRFCRSHGFDEVVGYSVQPAQATRTIGDYEAQDGQFANLRAFYAIRCASARDEATIALI